MPKITALSNIKHNGKDYTAGDTLDVNKSDAEYLVALGAAKAGGAAEKKGKADAAEPVEESTDAPEAAPAATDATDGSDGTAATTT